MVCSCVAAGAATETKNVEPLLCGAASARKNPLLEVTLMVAITPSDPGPVGRF